jgi:uncharacterized protein (TIGR02246 family)
MRTLRAGLCLAIAAILSAAALAAQPNPEAGIRGALDQIRRAIKDNDAERLTQMYTPDARLTTTNKVVEGRDAIRAYLTAVLPFLGDFRDDEQEFVAGGAIAVETGRVTFLDRSGAVMGVSHYMTVWKNAGGQWQVYRDFYVPVSPATPQAAFAVKQAPAQTAVVLPMTGSYAQHIEAIVRLVEYLKSAGIEIAGPPFGRYYNSPGSVPDSQLHWEVGLPVSREPAAVTAPFQKLDSPPTTVAFAVVPGRDTAGPWSQIGGWLTGQGYLPSGPAMEVWIDSSKTEIRLPVRQSGH